jgi:hypothetical protein
MDSREERQLLSDTLIARSRSSRHAAGSFSTRAACFFGADYRTSSHIGPRKLTAAPSSHFNMAGSHRENAIRGVLIGPTLFFLRRLGIVS